MPSHIWNHAPTSVDTTSLPDLSNIRVLVAEDSETNQLIIGQMLRLMGAEFETAADGVEALNWLERERFDFAMLDIDMPRLSGIEVMRHIRAQTTELRDLPILAVTAFTLRANRDAIYDAGANRILAKPINGPEALGYSICALLDIATRQDTTGRILARMGDTLNEEHFAHLLSIAGPDSTGELLSRLCTDLKDVERLLGAALNARNLPDTRGQTHVLISLAGAVGAERLQRQSEALNAAAHRDDDVAFDVLGDGVLSQLEELIARVVLEHDAFLRRAAHG